MTTEDHRQEIASRGWEVPAFEVETFVPRRSRYLVVIPVINEGDRIRRQLSAMSENGLLGDYDTVVVDGGSTDGSLDRAVLAELGLRGVLVKTGSGKLSAQLRCGYAWALIEGYEGIITIDGNGKDSVETLPQFAAALDEGFGYAQASRFIAGGKAENTPLSRLLAIRLIHAPVLSLAARHRFTDTTQGYRAYSSAYLLDDRTRPFRAVFDRYELLAYLTVRASQLDYRVTEIATSRVYPRGEPVPTKIAGLRGLGDLLLALFRALRGAYDPDPAGSAPR